MELGILTKRMVYPQVPGPLPLQLLLCSQSEEDSRTLNSEEYYG